MDSVLIDTSTGRLQNLPQAEIDRRIRCARELLEEQKLDLILVVNPACGGYRYWFTGASGPERASEGGILIGREGNIISVTGGRLAPRGAKLPENFSQGKVGGDCVYQGVTETDGFFAELIEAAAFPDSGQSRTTEGTGDACADTARAAKGRDHACADAAKGRDDACAGTAKGKDGDFVLRAGVVNFEWLRADLLDFLREEFLGILLFDITEKAGRVKAKKSEAELAAMRDVARMTDKVFAAGCVSIRPQVYERDIVNDMRYAAYQTGCGGPDYLETAKMQLISGRDGAPAEFKEPVWPGRLVTEGDRVNVRMYCMGTNSFYGVLGRSFVLGEPCGQTKKMWETAREAQRRAAEALLPGAKLKDVAELVNTYLREQGYREDGRMFLHGLGYTADEAPRLYHPSEEWELTEGMVIVVEPTVSDGVSEPVCCGDVYVLEADGAKRIGTFPQELVRL